MPKQNVAGYLQKNVKKNSNCRKSRYYPCLIGYLNYKMEKLSRAYCRELLKVFFEEFQVVAPHNLIGNLPDFRFRFTGKQAFGSCHLPKFLEHSVIESRKFVSIFISFYGRNHSVKIGAYADIIPDFSRIPCY